MPKANIKGGLWKSRIKRSDNTKADRKGLSRRASKNLLSIVPPGFELTCIGPDSLKQVIKVDF